MFRIRKVPDARASANLSAIAQAQNIIRAQFPGLNREEIDALPQKLENPFKQRFVAELFVAENARALVRAAAVILYDPELAFGFLDIIATAPAVKPGSGVGGALYQRLCQEAEELGARGFYFECLPDEAALSPDPEIRKQNVARLKFYERFGAYPIIGTRYETPVSPGDFDAPYLMFDGFGRYDLPEAKHLRAIIRAILERKYGDLCPKDYNDRVIGSIQDGAYALRPPRYVKNALTRTASTHQTPIPLIVNDKHDIHHVRERGYVESPVRIATILGELEKSGLFEQKAPGTYPDRWIREVHDAGLIAYLKRACAEAPEKNSVYPYVFPVRNAARLPKERSVLAGYWCIDTFTPINRNAWPAARRAVDCAMSAADAVLSGAPMAYALIRPPGHHAEHKTFGGFCYFCNGAVAANYLSHYGRVAILDIDYHHGNGQQDIFYERADVLCVSIHGDPSFAYPYFTGFAEETGRGNGAGYNCNLPLAESITPELYRKTLEQALARIDGFAPEFLVLSLGFDTGRGDPTGTWPNRPEDFRKIGVMIGAQGYPTVVIQEGGYRVRTLGANSRNFFEGLVEGARGKKHRPLPHAPRGKGAKPRRVWRTALHGEDPEAIRTLVAATGKFSPEEIEIARAIAQERIAQGRASGYEFVLINEDKRLLGFCAYGRIPGSEISWDIYWIAVAPDYQGQGLGSQLLKRAESAISRGKGRWVQIETSAHGDYENTRNFYESLGYVQAAEFPEFYRPGDGKIVFRKDLSPG